MFHKRRANMAISRTLGRIEFTSAVRRVLCVHRENKRHKCRIGWEKRKTEK